MSQRLNKNGIPILDPPGQNHLKRRSECVPGEHDWGPPTVIRTVPGDWVYMEPDRDVLQQECRRCGTKDEYTRDVE